MPDPVGETEGIDFVVRNYFFEICRIMFRVLEVLKGKGWLITDLMILEFILHIYSIKITGDCQRPFLAARNRIGNKCLGPCAVTAGEYPFNISGSCI